MANWSLPTTASSYVNYTAELDARLDDVAYGLDPAITTLTNPQTNMVRWSSTVNKWQKYNGTAWNDLAATYAINAATASAWQTGRTITLTGDVTATSAAWTGSGNISIAATLPTVNANVGAFGSTSAIPVVTVNAKGLVTAVSTATLGSMATQSAASVAITGGAISGTAITLVQSTTAAPTAEGVIQWDTDDDVLKIGTGTATKTVVNTDNTQTLTNKTLGTSSVWNGGVVGVLYGGTGAADAATARTNLGIGSISTQAASSVAITGGTISGTAIMLVQSTTAAPTAEGRLEWDTDDDLLILGTSTGSKTQVNTDSTQTLSNKTFGNVVYLSDAGFMFNSDGGKDTGISWASDGVMNVRINNATVGQFNSTGYTGNAATATRLATARAINGTNFDGSAAITITANTTQALTFASDGTGAAATSTFNGDTARVISYNSVGAPSATGANASGTWSINVSGNAATVTNGVYTEGVQSVNGAKTFLAEVTGRTAGTSAVASFRAASTGGSYADMYTRRGAPFSSSVGTTGSSYAPITAMEYNHNGGWAGVYSTGVLNNDAQTAGAFVIHHLSGTAGNSFAWTFSGVEGDFTSPGNITAYSDARLKTDLQVIPKALDKVCELTGYTYTRTDSGQRQTGLIAQDVQRVLPEAVVEGEHLSLAYGNLMGLMVEAIKELKAKIQMLEAR